MNIDENVFRRRCSVVSVAERLCNDIHNVIYFLTQRSIRSAHSNFETFTWKFFFYHSQCQHIIAHNYSYYSIAIHNQRIMILYYDIYNHNICWDNMTASFDILLNKRGRWAIWCKIWLEKTADTKHYRPSSAGEIYHP